jgi:hypothetical protein
VLATIIFVGVFIAAVVGFVVASVRNADRYAESLQPPEDLRRADQSSNPSAGSPNGGSLWPDGH